MPAAKKNIHHPTPKKKRVGSSAPQLVVAATERKKNLWQKTKERVIRARDWRKSLQPRSPHRSFRWTRRRDYVRPLDLPGYVAFSVYVLKTIGQHKKTFGGLALIYALLTTLLVGLASQTTYAQLADLLRSSSSEIFQGNFGQVRQAGVLLMATLSGGFNPNLSDSQQLISGFFVMMVWLTTVWLLRAYMAGSTPRLRDGFYNSGAPIIPTMILALVLIVQLIPAAIAAIGISAALPTGLVSQGVEAMLFWMVALLLGILSLYWVTSTSIALVVVTLPGIYPFHALKTANELVIGRRLRIVLRMVWLVGITIVLWVVIMLPIILFDTWLKGVLPSIRLVPIVPVALVMTSTFSVIWIASYIYLLYRKVVDDTAAPA